MRGIPTTVAFAAGLCSMGRLSGVSLASESCTKLLMVVADVFTHEPAQMSFVQHDDLVQHLPAATPYPSFRGSILPGRLGARALRCQSRGLQKPDDLLVELRVSIQNHVTIRGGLRKCFAQLLDDPVGRGVSSYVAVQDFPPVVLDDKEAIEHLEGHGRYGKEVESHDGFPVVVEKCPPPLSRIATAPHPPQITSHGPFGDLESQFQ